MEMERFGLDTLGLHVVLLVEALEELLVVEAQLVDEDHLAFEGLVVGVNHMQAGSIHGVFLFVFRPRTLGVLCVVVTERHELLVELLSIFVVIVLQCLLGIRLFVTVVIVYNFVYVFY